MRRRQGNEKSHLRNQKKKAVQTDCFLLLLCEADFELHNDIRQPKAAEGVGQRSKNVPVAHFCKRCRPKQGVLRAICDCDTKRLCDDDRAMKNPTSATILCIQNRCQPKKTRCRKASGLFCTHFSQCNFGRCQTLQTPCGWDLNLNNRLFRVDFAIFQSPGLPFFRLFQKNICKQFIHYTTNPQKLQHPRCSVRVLLCFFQKSYKTS